MKAFLAFFGNKYFVAIVVPLLFSFVGIVVKKLVRGEWDRKDFFLGVELSLATLSSVLVNFFDLVKDVEQTDMGDKIILNSGFCILNLSLLFVVVSNHQTFEKAGVSDQRQFWILGVLTNFIGLGLMFAFILLIKGT
jgi:hypothetical protein